MLLENRERLSRERFSIAGLALFDGNDGELDVALGGVNHFLCLFAKSHGFLRRCEGITELVLSGLDLGEANERVGEPGLAGGSFLDGDGLRIRNFCGGQFALLIKDFSQIDERYGFAVLVANFTEISKGFLFQLSRSGQLAGT